MTASHTTAISHWQSTSPGGELGANQKASENLFPAGGRREHSHPAPTEAAGPRRGRAPLEDGFYLVPSPPEGVWVCQLLGFRNSPPEGSQSSGEQLMSSQGRWLGGGEGQAQLAAQLHVSEAPGSLGSDPSKPQWT